MRLKDLLETMSPTIKFIVVGNETSDSYSTTELFDNTINDNTLLDFNNFINSIYGDFYVLSITYIRDDHPFDDYLRIHIFNLSSDG